jgi:hypothetical protein
VEWDTNPGKQEVQTLTTSTYTGANEIQSITTTATVVQEQQNITVSATAVAEVQNVAVSGATGGSFFLILDTTASGGSLQYSGDISIAYPASGSSTGLDVTSILESMTNIGQGVSVTLTTATTGSYLYVITFPVSMGNVPQITVIDSALTPVSSAATVTSTVVEGNVVGGTFRLSFEDQTTSSLAYDASTNDVRIALEALTTIGTVQVTRTGPDFQLGYSWLVTFTSDVNSGYQPLLIPDYTGLTVSSAASGTTRQIDIHTVVPGNEIGGTFTVAFTNTLGSTIISRALNYNATATEFQNALNETILLGAVSVSRTGPDGQMGYAWSVSFLEDYARLTEGPQSLFVPDYTLLTGTGAVATAVKVRTGTVKEVQKISVTTSPSTAAVNHTAVMILNYQGQKTVPIYLLPFSTFYCNSSVTEVQSITSSTTDTTTSGGDNEVSIYLQLRLRFGDEVTSFINANPSGTGDCTVAAAAIQTALESFVAFDTVEVTGAATLYSACVWTVRFVSTIGNIDQLEVQAYNSVTKSVGSYGYTSNAGDDTVTTATVTKGEKDSIKAALESLSNVGAVTVTAVNAIDRVTGTCTWKVTFDTNTGNLDLLTVGVYDANHTSVVNSTNVVFGSTSTRHGIIVGITEVTAGDSVAIAGNFALSYMGSRSVYLPYNVSSYALKTALQMLDTIGQVDVTRSFADENNGYTWSVTFLTELGSLDLMQFDGTDMTGTVVTGVVAKLVTGVTPPFNSLDTANGLPLGAAIVTDMSSLSLLVSYLDEGIAYYFRVAAINSIGQGPFALSSTPYAVPVLQQPGLPVDPVLTVVDGTSMMVVFQPPTLDGGSNVDSYKVLFLSLSLSLSVSLSLSLSLSLFQCR